MESNEIDITVEEGVIFGRVMAPHLDEERSQALLHQLRVVIEKSPGPVLVNLAQVTVMPSMAIGALVTLWKKVQDTKQRFFLVGTQGNVRRTLTVCRLDKLFEFSDTEAEAKAASSTGVVEKRNGEGSGGGEIKDEGRAQAGVGGGANVSAGGGDEFFADGEA